MKSRLYIFKKAYSLEARDHFYTAALVNGRGLIEKLFNDNELNDYIANITNAPEIFDFSNLICLPGFFDSHVHLMQTGYNSLAIRFENCRSIKSMKERFAEALRTRAAHESDVLIGHGFDETAFREKRMPQKDDLDAISKDVPIFLSRVDHHSCVVNSAFIKRYESFFKTLDKDVFKTGILRQKPNYAIKSVLIRDFSKNVKKQAFAIAEAGALKAGVTSLCALEGGAISDRSDVYFIDEIIQKKINKLDLILFDQSPDYSAALELELPRVGGCLLVDGSFGSKTAALGAPYKNEKMNAGAMYLDKKFMESFIEGAQLRNLQTAFHAIGDLAINSLLDCYESVLKKQAGGIKNYLRHRIEHFELAGTSDIKRAAELGIILSMQPYFETLWGGKNGMYADRLGVKRALKTNRFKTILSCGAIIAGGSDSDVTPISPINGIHALLNLPNENERLSIHDAVCIFTKNGAYANFMERSHGTLACNKAANFTLIDRDIFKAASKDIEKTAIAATIVAGKVEYLNEKFHPNE